MSEFVDAVVKATGQKQRVPAHFLDDPTFGELFRLPPSSRKDAETAVKPLKG